MKTVNCKICGHTNKINGDESSVRCESCGCYIDLDNTISNNSIRCPYCNTPLDIKNAKDGVLKCSCKDCHEAITLPKDNQTDDVKQLIENGKIKLNICHFKEALELFNAAIEKAPNEPEAYFNYALARYQIQYLRDLKNRRMQPICHVYRDRPFREDQSYRKALSLATDAQKEVYESKAKEIEKIQMEFAKLEKQKINYDCFICTKVSEDDGKDVKEKDKRKTIDSQKAYDIYHMLQNKGFHPFYSEALMGEHTGEVYEAHILYALYKAKCILIVCSDEKYLDTPWVKNEYTRYLGLVNSGNKKVKDSLAIIYLNSVIETLPLPGYEDTKLQGLDFKNSLTFADSLTKFISKCLNGRVETEKITVLTGKKEKIITPKQDIQLKTISENSVVDINPNLEEILKKIKSLINIENEYNDFSKAKRYIVTARHIDAGQENSEIDYLAFLIKYKIHSLKELSSDLKINVKEIDKIIKKSNSEFAPKIFSEIYQCISALIDSGTFDKKFVLNLYQVVDEYNDESVNKLSRKLVCYALKTCDNEIFFAAYKARSKSAEYVNKYREDLLTLLRNAVANKKFEAANEDIKVLDELYSGNVTVVESKLLIKYHCANFEELFNYETKFNDYEAIKEILEYSSSLENLIFRVTTWIDDNLYKLINDTTDKKKKLFYYNHIENLIKFINDDSDKDSSDDELQRKELRKLGEQAQKDLNFKEAISYYNKALNIDSKNVVLQAEIYFDMALCDIKCANVNDCLESTQYIFDSPYYASLINYLVDKNRLDLKEKYSEIEEKQSKNIDNKKQMVVNKKSQKAQIVRRINAGVLIAFALLALVFSFFDFNFINDEFLIAALALDVIIILASISEMFTFRKISTTPFVTNQILLFIQSYFLTNLIYKMILEKSLIILNLFLSLIGIIVLIIYLILQKKKTNRIDSLKSLLLRFIPTLVLGVVIALELLTSNIIYLIAGAVVLFVITIILRKYRKVVLSLNFVYIFTYFVFFSLFYIFNGNYLLKDFNIIKDIAEFDYLKIGVTLFVPFFTPFIVGGNKNKDALYNLDYFAYALILMASLFNLVGKVNLTNLTIYTNSNYSNLPINNAFLQLLFCLIPQFMMSILLCRGIENINCSDRSTIVCFILGILLIVSKWVYIFSFDLLNSYTFEPFIIMGIDIINIIVISVIALEDITHGKIIATFANLLFIGGLVFGYIKVQDNNISFKFSSNDSGVTLERISGKNTGDEKIDLVIPSYYGGKKVTELSSDLLSQSSNKRAIKNLYIPNTIDVINRNPFSYANIDNIYYGGTINDWLNIEFTDNPKWKSNLYFINNENEYKKISHIEIPNTVTSIGDYQFAGITSLYLIDIPDSVTSIGYHAFADCSNATIYCENVALADTATNWNYSNLSVIYGTNSSSSMDLSLNEDNEVEIKCTKQLTDVVIPTVIVKDRNKYVISKIGTHTFDSTKTTLTNLTISSNITRIENDAFKDCSTLENVYYRGAIEDWFNIEFGNEYSNPMSYAKHFYMLNSNNEYEEVTSINIPDTVTKIGKYRFYGFNNVTSITIPNSVTTIGNGAFKGCSSLEKITLPFVGASQNATGDNAKLSYIFGETVPSSLKEVVILEGCTSIKANAFYGCTSLASITLPSSVTTIGEYAFYYCESLTSIAILSSVTTIGKGAFWNCASLTIYCEATSIPSGWSSDWNSGRPVYYGITKENKIEKDGIIYVIQNDEAIVTRYVGNDTSVTIPNTIELNGKTYKVTTIGNSAFISCTSLTSISIPSSVATIKGYAFRDCTSLKSITIPDSVTTIEKWAFYACAFLTIYCEAETQPSEWDSEWNYGDSSSYSSLPVYYGVTKENKIENDEIIYMIQNDEAIVAEYVGNDTSVTIPNTIELNGRIYKVTAIGEYAFANFTSLTNIIIPNSVTTIGKFTFVGCALIDIALPKSLTKIEFGAFYCCTSLTSITIPSSVTKIGNGAFASCTSLTSIYIPSSVATIGEYAFGDCNSLENVYYEGTIEDWCNIKFSNQYSSPMCYANHFYMLNSNNEYEEVASIEIPNMVTNIGKYQFLGFNNVTSITIPNDLDEIGEGAFAGCKSLTSITIPSSVTIIGNSAFWYCISLEKITLPFVGASQDATGDNAKLSYIFGGTVPNSLKEVIILEGCTSIGEDAFSNCTSLTIITLPSTIETIGYGAFSGCTSLEKITLPFVGGSKDNNTYLGYIFGATSYSDNSKYVPSSLKEIIILEGCTSIKDYAFSGCKSLASITIPNSVTTIGKEAFEDCTSLTSITLPSSVTTIGDYAFSYCTSLENVYYEGTIEDWCNIKFSNMASTPMNYANHFYMLNSNNEYEEVTSIVIPKSVTSIGNYQFCEFNNVTSITIPSSVTTIGDYAFYDCTSLTSITIPSSVTKIGDGAFYDCTSLTSITLPSSVTTIGGWAFVNCSSLTSITLPSSVTKVGSDAFYNCTSLTSITIPSCVTTIGNYAFKYCSSLTIHCEATSKPSGWDSVWNPDNRPVVWGYKG